MLSDWEQALVDECRAARLATIGTRAQPNLVPVCYAYDEGRFVIAIDEKPKSGRKLARVRNIERDRRVTLLIDRYDDDWTRLAWVRVEGEAVLHEHGSERPAALKALRRRYWQYQDMGLEELPMIEITPVRVISWRWDGDRP